jgi:hypothetical protein
MPRLQVSVRAGILAAFVASLVSACGGGSTSAPTGATPVSPGAAPPVAAPPGTAPPGAAPPGATAQSAVGVWEGTITSQATGQVAPMLGMVDAAGASLWITADGRVMAGPLGTTMPQGAVQVAAHMDQGGAFANGSLHGSMHFSFESVAAGALAGHVSGMGDTYAFRAAMSGMWNRPASLAALAGVYTRATGTGYTVTLAIGADGRLSGSDTRGCVLNGLATVPDPARNLYRLTATVTSCGTLNGDYAGMGTLVDATAMSSWLRQMPPLAMGGMHGGGMMHSGPMNTIPTGASNLFMFALTSGQHAIMDALAR